MFENGKDKRPGEFAPYLSLHVPLPVWHLQGYFEGSVRSLKHCQSAILFKFLYILVSFCHCLEEGQNIEECIRNIFS